MRRAWLPAGVVLVLALALGTRASAAERLSALDPVEIYADGFDDLRGVVVDPRGNVFVADRAAGTVTRIAPNHTRTVVARRLQRPIGLALDPSGRLLIAEEKAGRVVRVEANGSRSVIVSGVERPHWLATREDGTLFISARRLTRDTDAEDDDESSEDDESAEPEMILVLSPTGHLGVFADGFKGLQGMVANHTALFAATQGRRGKAQTDGVLFQIPFLADGSAGVPVAFGPRDAFKKPVGLARDRLGALYLTTPEVDRPKEDAKHAVAKLHPTAVVTVYAENLEKPQGLAFDQDGHLYVADGSSGRVLRFLAPRPPTLNAEEFINHSPLEVTGTTLSGARVDLFVNDALTPTTVTTDSAGAFSASITVTPNVSNTLEAFATSHGGHGLTSRPAEVTVVHDDSPPTVTFVQPAPSAYVRQTVTVQAQASDANKVASLALTADAQALTATLTPTLPPPAASVTARASFNTRTVPDGTHTFGATATDQAGNTATATRVVIVDNSPPDTFITGSPSGEINVPTATFSFTGADNLTPVGNIRFAWRLDGGAFTPFTLVTTASFSGLAEGPHTFEVKALDLAGNEDLTPASRTFTVRFGPSITNVDPASGTIGTLVTITGTAFETGATTVTFNGLAAVIRTISATTITTTVPIGASTGPLVVTTSRGTASRTFTVGTTGDFTLIAAPATARAVPGDQTSVNIAAGGSGSFTSLVSLTISTPAAGITVGFSPSNLVAPGASAFVNVALASAVAPGSYGFTVTGQAQVDGRSVTRTAAFTLEVLAPDTTAITGRVLTAEAVPQPIPGVTVTLGAAFTLTDAGGNFVLLAPPAGANMLLVDGRTASTATVQYPPVEVNIAVNTTGPTRVPFVVYLPKLDTANPVTLPLDSGGFTTQEVKATTPTIPGLVVTVPAGTKITGPDGNPVSQITITPVPIDRSPMPFPAGVTPPMLFTIQPGGAVPSQPLPITFPNVQNAPPGSQADLYFFDLATGGWAIWGTGTVSQDGTQVVSDPGFGLPRFAWHFTSSRVSLSDQLRSNEPGRAQGGEPVDLPTGRFFVRKTDLVLPGRIPVAIQRTYRSENPISGLLGIGWTLDPYDTTLTTAGTSMSLILPDQSTNLFAPSGSGQWTNTQQTFLRGAVLTQLSGDFIFQLRFKDGTVHRFERIFGFSNLAALTQITDRNGNTLTLTREQVFQQNKVTRITEPAGRAVTLVYDSAGRITSITDPIGRVVQYAYDAQGRLSTVTDPVGGITRYTYDASHRILTITDPRNITFLTNTYDATGRVSQQTQADGGVWSFAYALEGTAVIQTTLTDPRGNSMAYRFNSQGFTLAQTDGLGQTTTFDYAAGSNLLLATTDPLGRVTRFTYDAQGNVTSVTDPAGNQRTFTYDPAFSKIASIRDPLGNVTSFAYDAQGNLTSVTDPLGKVTTLTSNAFGQPLTTTDPLGNTSTFTYDAQGNLATVADPLGNTTTREYDAVSRLARQTDPRGKPTAFAYDPLNRVTAILDALGGATRFAYDGNGNLLTVADPLGNATTYTYDAMDRVATRSDPLGHSESFTYDPAGNLTGHTDRKGQAATFAYDALNRRTGATYLDATVTSTYDAVGRLTRATDSAGGTITNAYDTLDRLVSQTAALGTVGYTYDGLGRRTTMIVPGQPEVSYAYDPASRLSSITQGSSLVQFAYDAASRRTTLTLPNGVTTQYGYDSASRLTALTYTLAATVLGDLQYTYDAAGNRTGVAGSWARTGLPQSVAGATYNANNQQLTFGSQTLTYDLNGNLTSDGTSTYAWTARNQLAAIVGPVPASFVYDGAGRRIRKAINGTITDFLYDSVNPIQEVSGAAAASLLTGLGIDEYFVRADTNGASALLTDVLGSTVALTDPAGAVQMQYTYEPFGQTVTTGAVSSSPFQYTGRENDGTGVYYYRARYYHPQLSRFVSEDPIGFGGGINTYAYVGNDPLSNADPLGLCQIAASFRPLGGIGSVGWSHAFITATDASGTTYFGAFPNGPGPSSGASGALGSGSTGSGSHMSGRSCPSASDSSANSSSGNFGTLVTRVGPYVPGVAGSDYAPAGTFPSLPVLDNSASCSPYNQALANAMGRITQSNIPYDPFYNNSNAAAWTALKSAGLNPAWGLWPPGWGHSLLP